VACAFLIGYGALRFVTEYFREPDEHIGYLLGGLTVGQLLCIGMVLAGTAALAFVWRSPPAPLPPPAAPASPPPS
jgi:phosphatidylglycerol---prolipoprotein diacylglyceryl transferase